MGNMRYRKLPHGEETISEIGLGRDPSMREAKKKLKKL